MSSIAPTTRRARVGRAGFRLPWLLVLLVAAGADEYRPTPRFEGRAIPDPPRQHDPWTPPATRLPRFLVGATAALFEAGFADPRDCPYREVEIGADSLVKAHAFVLPERPGEAARVAVGWDGVLYPAFHVGPAADLDADIRGLAEAVRRDRPEALDPKPGRGRAAAGFSAGRGPRDPFGGGPAAAAVEGRSARKVVLLLRLGRADLAETLFAAATPWTPDAPRRDLTDYRISLLTLAAEWVADVYGRITAAQVRGDDVVALDAARRLAGFFQSVDAKAGAMGFPPAQTHSSRPGPSPYFGFGYEQFPALLADQERRAKEPPRGPIPRRGGDPSARVAALIRDLDQVGGGDVWPSRSPGPSVVRELIAEGDAAVGPLLTALESDARLTRSVPMSFNRRSSVDTIRPVVDDVYGALTAVLRTSRFVEDGPGTPDLKTPASRKRLAAAARSFWEKNRAVPLAERWFRALNDDAAGAGGWLEAATGMIAPADGTSSPGVNYVDVNRLGQPGPRPPMQGDPYRSRRDPSVADLMARRAAAIARSGDPMSTPDRGLGDACRMALILARWDEPASLPPARALMTACIERSRPDPQGQQSNEGLSPLIATFALLRARAGDRAALDEYAAWVGAIGPRQVERSLLETLSPLWIYPDAPALAAAARKLFLDPGSPWLPLVPSKQGAYASRYDELAASPLICVPAFREALLLALSDRAAVGKASRSEQGVQYTMDSGASGGVGTFRVDGPGDRPGSPVAIRACDVIAWKLAALGGAPECELYWPEARRDEAVAACAAYLRRYGRLLSAETLPGGPTYANNGPHLRFPGLRRPATAEDVREARAIFSAEGEGEARVATVAGGLPARARWVTLRAFPIDQPLGDKTTRRDYLQDGLIWQAEEVRRGDRWERYYGFVGHATIARVPASEVEFPADPWRVETLKGGLDARLKLADPPGSGFPVGRPIVATLTLRNRLGTDRSAPTEFLRRSDDGRPVLRRGVGLSLSELPRGGVGQGINRRGAGQERTPSRTARFDPGDAARTLGPNESFEAIRIDLVDWFPPLGPGLYRLRLTFAADSGVGEGASDDAYVTILGDQPTD